MMGLKSYPQTIILFILQVFWRMSKILPLQKLAFLVKLDKLICNREDSNIIIFLKKGSNPFYCCQMISHCFGLFTDGYRF